MSRRGTGVDDFRKVPVPLWVSRLSFKAQTLVVQKIKSQKVIARSPSKLRASVQTWTEPRESHIIDQPTSSTNVVADMVEGGTTYLHNPGQEEDDNNTLEPHVPTIDCEAFAPLKNCHLVHIRSGIRRQRVGTSFREDSSKAQQADVTSR